MFALDFVEGMKGKQGTPSGITADVVTSSLRAGAGAEGLEQTDTLRSA